MRNKSLKNDLKEILSDTSNIRVKKGGVSMHSIEIEFIEETTFSSYIYYDKASERDADFSELELLLLEN
jgi:hypothetical protein